MATVTHRVSTADTSNTNTYATSSFTPVAGELLVAIVHAAATVQATPTMTASANGITFTRHTSTPIFNAGTINEHVVFVANQLVPGSPSSMTVTFSCVGDNGTGAITQVVGVSGMAKTGTTAIRQIATQSNASASTTPTTAFGVAALTGNPTLSAVGNSSATTPTAPTSWTKTTTDQTFSTPLTGANIAVRNSGFTSTSIAWGGNSATVYSTIAVELDTSGTDATATPSVVAATTSIPTPALPAGATATPSVVAATTSFGSPTISSAVSVGGSRVGTPTIGAGVNDNSGTTNVPYPSVVNAGDTLILAMSLQTPSGVGTITAPGGWTNIAELSSNTSTPKVSAYTKLAAGTEGGTNLSVTYTSATPNFSAQILAFPNAAGQDVTVSTLDTGVGSGTTSTIPGQTLATEGDAQITLDANNTTNSTATPPPGMIETWDGVDAGGNRAFEVAYATNLTSGFSGDRVVTFSNASRSVGILIALKPIAPGVGLTATTSIPTPTITVGGTNATATPSVVSATTTVGTAVVGAGSGVSPAVVAATTSIPTPVITSRVTIAASVVNGVTTVGTAVVGAGSGVSPAVVQATTSIPTPVITSRATVTPSVVAAVTSIPTPTIGAGSDVSPSVVNAVTTIPTPVITSRVTIAASLVNAVTTIPTPTVTTASNATATPSVVNTVTTIPTPLLAVTFDAVGPSSAGQTSTGTGTITWAHTCAASATLLVVEVAIGAPSPGTSAAVTLAATYNGVAMTSRGRASSTRGAVEVFELVSPPTGSAFNVVVTPSGASAGTTFECGSKSYINAGSLANVATNQDNVSGSSPATVTVTSSATSSRVGAAMAGGSNWSSTTGTLRWRANFASTSQGGDGQGVDYTGSTPTVAVSNGLSADKWSIVGYEIPLPSASASANPTPGVVNSTTSFGTAVVATGSTATPPVVNVVTSIPTPTVGTSSNATATPSVVSAVTTIPTPTITSSVAITPAVVNAVTTFGTAVVKTGSTVTPAVVNAVTSFGTAVVKTGSTIAPAVVAAVTSIPAPTLKTGETVPAAVVNATTSIPTPVITSRATATPSVVQATTSVGTVTVKTGETVTPAVVQATTTIPNPTVSTSGNVNIAAAVVQATTSFGTAVVSTGSRITAAVVQAVTSIPTPGVKTGETVTPVTVTAVTSVPTPTVTTNSSANATPVTVTCVTSVPTPVISSRATVTPAVVSSVVTIGTAVVTTSASVLVAPGVVLAVTVIGGGQVVDTSSPPLDLEDPRAYLVPNPNWAIIVNNPHGGIIEMDNIVAGDTAPPFSCILTNKGAPYDATGATSVRVHIWQDGVLLLDRPATSVSADGRVTLDWQAGDTDEPGPIKSRVVVVSGGDIETFPPRGFLVTNISPASP